MNKTISKYAAITHAVFNNLHMLECAWVPANMHVSKCAWYDVSLDEVS